MLCKINSEIHCSVSLSACAEVDKFGVECGQALKFTLPQEIGNSSCKRAILFGDYESLGSKQPLAWIDWKTGQDSDLCRRDGKDRKVTLALEQVDQNPKYCAQDLTGFCSKCACRF